MSEVIEQQARTHEYRTGHVVLRAGILAVCNGGEFCNWCVHLHGGEVTSCHCTPYDNLEVLAALKANDYEKATR